MGVTNARLDHVEKEIQFRLWLRRQRIFETMTADELEAYAISGIWVDQPEPAFGTSRFDSMDRENLIKLWKEDVASFAGRDGTELEFYAIHGRLPKPSAALQER